MTFGTKVPAKYFDGVKARSHAATATLIQMPDGDVLQIAVEGGKVLYWGAKDLRELQDQAGSGGIVLSHSEFPSARLVISDKGAADMIRKVGVNLGRQDRAPGTWRKVMGWGGAAVGSVVLLIFVIIPALSDTMAGLIPAEQEAALGRGTLRQIENLLGADEDGLACSTTAGDAALAKMTRRVLGDLDPGYDLNVQVFDNSMVNAFAVPGGNIVLFQGLIDASDTPEEVAAVLAHEIGHVVKRDPTRLALRSAGSVGILGLMLGDFAGGALMLILAERLIAASYSQEAEAAADRFAFDRMRAAGLPVEPFAVFFEKLQAEHGSTPSLLSHLASHPDLAARAAAARDAAQDIGDFTPVLSPSEWDALKTICKG